MDETTYPVLSGLARTGPRSAADLARIAWATTDTDPQHRAADCLTALRTLYR